MSNDQNSLGKALLRVVGSQVFHLEDMVSGVEEHRSGISSISDPFSNIVSRRVLKDVCRYVRCAARHCNWQLSYLRFSSMPIAITEVNASSKQTIVRFILADLINGGKAREKTIRVRRWRVNEICSSNSRYGLFLIPGLIVDWSYEGTAGCSLLDTFTPTITPDDDVYSPGLVRDREIGIIIPPSSNDSWFAILKTIYNVTALCVVTNFGT